jgi:hypothetical protein
MPLASWERLASSSRFLAEAVGGRLGVALSHGMRHPCDTLGTAA